MRKKWGWIFYLLMSLGIFELRAGESGLFLGGSLSLENAHYDGLFITQSAGPMRYYPHSNDSKNHIGFALRGGINFLLLMRVLERESILITNQAVQLTKTRCKKNILWIPIIWDSIQICFLRFFKSIIRL